MDRAVDLNSLMLFYEVIEAGSLTAAGEKLSMAKSTVSRRLARLEQHFGSVLVKKTGHRLILTEVGTNLYRSCRQIVGEVDQACREALTVHSGMQGTLRIIVPGDLGIRWLGGVVSDFVREFPNLTIFIEVHHSASIDVNKESFDVAIQVGETQPPQLICKHLASLSRGVYASPEYLARSGKPQSLEDCVTHNWIVTEVQEQEGLRLFRRRPGQRPIRVAHKIVVNSARLAREFALLGLGLTLVPDVLCADEVRNQRLVRVLGQWQTPPLQISALFLSRDKIPAKARTFLDFFAERVRRDIQSRTRE